MRSVGAASPAREKPSDLVKRRRRKWGGARVVIVMGYGGLWRAMVGYSGLYGGLTITIAGSYMARLTN